ncbi:D-alanyl-D-alanine carboxypeptidase [Streptomyces sp. NPDC058279]|uniref:D-alanyl-D-alanine carboxypeptidase n=1 Tax=Streptomyces sp. NPDC058279 TaxID=3346418 RepID=UPI0036E691C5
MAGESPDKSVDEGASGTAESAAPSAERDPRLSVLRPREAGSGDRDALKEAVAAWVATSASGDSTDSEPGAGAEAGADSEARADRRPADAEDPKSGSASAEDEPERAADAEERDSAKASRPAEPEKTAFGVVKSGSASGAGSADRRSAASEEAKPKDEKPKGDAAEAPAEEPRTAAPSKSAAADSERTAVFRAVKPDAAAPEKKPADGSRTVGPEKKVSGDPRSAPGKPGAADAGADSERTAVFRAVKPDAAAPEKKPAASGPQGRGSTFVPLGGNGPKPPAPTSAPRPAPQPTRPQPSPDAERTTQQPLPPKPPLDMLADLTNNPPPPPTPLRTALRRFKIYAPIVVLLAVVLAVVQLVRPLPAPRLALSAKSSYTFDGGAPTLPWPKEGQGFMAAAGLGTVGTFGEQKPIAIGSVAKTMTAYVILKNHPMKPKEKGPMIDVDRTAVDDGRKESEGESTVNTLKEGDKISEYDALAAIMIPSANNVARLLARWDTAGDQAAFVKKMNDAAQELGMSNTTYTDPSGLDPTTVSTAEDQVKLGLKIVEMPELLAITKLPSWTDPSGKSWRNYNDLIPYNGAVGIKTGSTTKAGGNLLFAAEKKVGKTNQLIVGAVLGQYGVPILGTAIAASKDVMLATQKALTNATVVKKGDVVGYVDDGLGGHTPVIATADVEAVGWPSLTVTVKLGDGGAKLPETAKAGTEVGVLTVGEGASQVKVPVALQRDLVAPGIGSKLTRVG